MKRTLWLLVAAAALAGCSGDDGQATDPVLCQDNEYEDEAGLCQPHVEPSIVVSGLPDTVQQYQRVDFNWSLDPGTRGMEDTVHSMDSRILASDSDGPVSNTTGPDDWGLEVARQQHKNLPDNFTATFRWDETGVLYLKGYMQIDGQNVWTDLGTVEVTQVMASGQSHTVTISGPPPEAQEADANIQVGDGVVFENTDPAVSYTVSFDCGLDDLSVGAGQSSDALVFLQPGQCRYTITSALAEYDPFAMTGTIQVSAP